MRAARLLALTIAAQLTAAVAATAAPPHAGDFDRSFGQKGRVKLSLPGERFVPSALVVQPDRKIVVAGTLVGDPASYPGSFAGRPAAIRFEPNGALDTGFGEAGLARMDAPQPTAIQGLAVQPDGALLLSGLTLPEDGVWIGAVVRLLPSGEVDDGFGSGGSARLPASSFAGYPPGVESVTQLAVQPDGRIVAAGSQDPYDVHSTADPYVARLMPDGRLDQSFGKDGRASFGPENPIAALARPSGDVVVVGSNSYHLGGSALSLLRVDPAGNDFPLPGHPTDAWVEHRYEAELVGVAASARPDGTIDFVGRLTNYESQPTRRSLLRLHIGQDLQILEETKVPKPDLLAATFDSHGAALTAGSWLYPYDTPPFKLQRYRGTGLLDRSFGNRKGSRNVFFDRPGVMIGMAMQGDKLILAGYTTAGRTTTVMRSLTLVRLNARQDESGPRLTVTGLPHRRCLDGVTDLLVLARDESPVTTRVWMDQHRLTTNTRHRFRLQLDSTELKPGRHRLRLRSTDAAGNLGVRSTTVRVCG